MSFKQNIYNKEGKYLGQIELWESLSELPGGDPATPTNTEIIVGGVVADMENPLSVSANVDVVSKEDLDFDSCELSAGWLRSADDQPATTEDIKTLFDKPSNGGLYFPASANPKTIKLAFKRTVVARVIGFGANSGTFSNISVFLEGSGGAKRGFLDLSGDDTKSTSQVFNQIIRVFNSAIIEFSTDDRVDISNLIIKNQYSEKIEDYVLKWGVNPEIDSGGNEDVWEGGDLYNFTTIPQAYYISSSSASDVGVEVSCSTVGVRSDGQTQENKTTITLDGQNSVLIPTELALQIASNSANIKPGFLAAGDVYIYESTAISNGIPIDLTKLRSIVLQENQRTQQAVFTAAHFLADGRKIVEWDLIEWSARAIKNKLTTGFVKLFTGSFDSDDFQLRASDGLSESAKSGDKFGINTPLKIDAGSRVWINVSEISVNDVAVKGGFNIYPITI